MKLIAALIEAQKTKNIAAESVLLKQIADQCWPLKKVNAHSAGPMPERFLAKVVFGASDCWTWRGHVDDLGYGRFSYKEENKAHRVSHSVFVGEIPKGKLVLHKCDNRQCVNPDHLFVGTQTDNMRDMASKGRGKPPALCRSRNPMAKLDDAKVAAIRQMVASGAKQVEASRAFGVSPMTVSRIVRGESWK